MARNVPYIYADLHGAVSKQDWNNFASCVVNISGNLSSMISATSASTLSSSVSLSPTVSTRNIIQPTSATVTPLVVKGFSNQISNLQQWQNSSGTTLAYVCSGGCLATTNSLILPSTSGQGLKVDVVNPSYGWKDLIGAIVPRNTGGTAPTFAVFRGAQFFYRFAVNNEEWVYFHMPHDYLPQSPLYIHAHWGHNQSTVSSGSVTWTFDVSYAKGYARDVFSPDVTTSVTQDAAVGISGQYMHMIAETQLSSMTPTVSQLNSDNLEIDGLISVHVYLSANTITGPGSPNDRPFLMFVDIHYQSTQMTTLNKNFPFYGTT